MSAVVYQAWLDPNAALIDAKVYQAFLDPSATGYDAKVYQAYLDPAAEVQQGFAPVYWGDYPERRQTEEEVKQQRIVLGIISPELTTVVAKKRTVKKESSGYWALHAYEQLLLQQIRSITEDIDRYEQEQKRLAAETQRIAEEAISRAKRREMDIAFVIAMMA